MYEVYKIWHGEKILLGYGDNAAEAAMLVERDMQDNDDNAVYQYQKIGDKPNA